MNAKRLFYGWAACAVIGLASGCGKEDSAPPPPPKSESKPATEKLATEAQKAVSTAATEIKQTATTAATQAKQAAEKVGADVAKQADAATTQAQGLIDRAKSLITEKKYQDALTTLKQLGSAKLTPEQQKLVDDLKIQAQKLVAGQAASDAAKSVGGLLDQKK